MTKNGTAIEVASDPSCLTQSHLQLIKDTYARDATDLEFQMFVEVANRLRLDPLSKQIVLIKRWDGKLNRYVATPQVTIDGFRVIAERSNDYAGQTPTQWCGKDGVWKDVWLETEPPHAARVGIHRHRFKEPLYAVAAYDSYVQRNRKGDPTPLWSKMPDLMLAKCAESLALRKAFPSDLSGVYTQEEMGQAETTEAAAPISANFDVVRAAQQEREKSESLDLARDWVVMIQEWKSEEDALRWAYHHGHILTALHATVKGRVWTAIKNKAKELGIEAAPIQKEIVASPDFADESEREARDTIVPPDAHTAVDPETGQTFDMTTPLGFGKYADRPMVDVPRKYCEWLLGQSAEDGKSSVIRARYRAAIAFKNARDAAEETDGGSEELHG